MGPGDKLAALFRRPVMASSYKGPGGTGAAATRPAYDYDIMLHVRTGQTSSREIWLWLFIWSALFVCALVHTLHVHKKENMATCRLRRQQYSTHGNLPAPAKCLAAICILRIGILLAASCEFASADWKWTGSSAVCPTPMHAWCVRLLVLCVPHSPPLECAACRRGRAGGAGPADAPPDGAQVQTVSHAAL